MSTMFHSNLLPPAESVFRASVQKFRRTGRRARAVCPFHAKAKNLNFSMDLDRGLYHCFVCGTSGDLVDFVMKTEHVDFVEATRSLGAWVPADPVEARKIVAERKAKREAEAARQAQYVNQLHDLLMDMAQYERALIRARRDSERELEAIAREGIRLIGARYILLRPELQT